MDLIPFRELEAIRHHYEITGARASPEESERALRHVIDVVRAQALYEAIPRLMQAVREASPGLDPEVRLRMLPRLRLALVSENAAVDGQLARNEAWLREILARVRRRVEELRQAPGTPLEAIRDAEELARSMEADLEASLDSPDDELFS